jgi:CheY-like chemotaxis protein
MQALPVLSAARRQGQLGSEIRLLNVRESSKVPRVGARSMLPPGQLGNFNGPKYVRPSTQLISGGECWITEVEGLTSTSSVKTKSRTVCLLDDDPSVVKATSRLLSSAGWKVDSFTDPVEFLRYAETCQPEVVVLDILMPAMNGLEVQKRLRTISPSSRVVVLTSKDDASVQAEAMQRGAAGFFIKPVNDDEFLDGIESAFSRN